MSEPRKFRKKPVVIEAMQWDGTPEEATPVINWMLDGGGTARYFAPGEWDSGETQGTYLVIDTLEGRMCASANDWVIRGVANEFYPCCPDVFAQTYEAVNDE